MKILIRNPRLIATMDDAGHRYEGGAVLIDNGKIAAVYHNGNQQPKIHADLEIDATDMLLTPGLINTHHHFYQTLTRNLPGGQNKQLFDWLIYHYEIWRELDEECIAVSTTTALAELLLSGCTLSSDHHYVFPQRCAPDLIDRQIESAQALGVRFQPTRGSMSLGQSCGGLPPDDLVQDEDTILADSRRLIERYHDAGSGAMTRIVLAPCSPFSVTAEAMRRTAELARETGVRLHTHVAETMDEEAFCLDTFGKRPVDLMGSLGWLGDDVWFAHTVHLSDDDIGHMAETATGMSHCPSSNMRLGSGIAPIRELLDAGAPVSLAVDGSASNDGNHLLAEARQMLLLSRLRKPENWLGADEVLRVATRGGAQVMGRPELGSIESGKAADLVLWDLRTLDLAGAQSDPVAALLFSGSAPRAHTVLVDGNVRVQAGYIINFHERAHAANHNIVAENMLTRAAARLGDDFIRGAQPPEVS
ncbi:MAG: 8-oxoguanine deaminase [bacterium]|nr:8-oxoguanine deaminase [bacterium]